MKAYSLINIPDHRCECNRCMGTGRIPNYAHIEGGICFKCKGSGLMWDGTFKAKYPGKCAKCGEEVKVGYHVFRNDSGNFKGVIGRCCY